MTKVHLSIARGLAGFFLAAQCSQTSAGQAGVPDHQRHVVVISLDAFPAYALRDPAIPLPVLRKLIREGASADSLEPVNPTVTWPNHTAMITGVTPARHGVLYNGLPVRGGEGKRLRVEPWIDKQELVQVPTVYDAAHDAGLTSAEVDWVAIYRAASVNWSFAEEPRPEGGVEREMIGLGLVTEEEIRSFRTSATTLHDEIWTRAAVHIIEKHRPNLLLFHLLTADSVQHRYGAKSLAGNTALILADRQIQRILDAIERAGIRNQTTILVVSDHGFKSYQHSIRPNALLREKGLLREKNGELDCDAWVIPEGGTAMVYVTRETLRSGTLKQLQSIFSKIPGIQRVILPADYSQFDYPQHVPGGRMAEMVLVAAPGYAFDGETKGESVVDVSTGATPGTHGYLNSDPDMHAIFVAWGAGIRPGVHLGQVRTVDIAPTIAYLLNVNFPKGQGAVPRGLLRK